jgi:hypothetical protein
MAIFLAAFLVHVGAAVFFWRYSQNNVSDALGYYDETLKIWTTEFGLGTQFVYWSVQTPKALFGGTFLDYFLVYQVIGFYGICALMRTFEEVHAELGVRQPAYVFLLLFMPSLHFWTSPIGKDGAMFFGITLAMWAFMDVRKRLVQLVLATIIIGLFRPHIALISTAAAALAMFFDNSSSRTIKALLLVLAVTGAAVAAGTIRSTFEIDVTNSDSVSDFLARQSEVTADVSVAGNTAVYGNFAFRLFSLLFRPLFLDAEGFLGLIASLENLLLLALILTLVFYSRETFAAIKSVTFLRFAALLVLGVAFILSYLYYNVGLGLRQKTMFTPAILLIFVALMAIRRARREAVNAATTAWPVNPYPAAQGSFDPRFGTR